MNRECFIDEAEIDLDKVRLGCVGSCSFAKEAQRFVHNDLGAGADPQGWDTQLRNEPVFQYKKGRFFLSDKGTIAGVPLDTISGLSGELGNIETHAQGELYLRLGSGIHHSVYPVLTRDTEGFHYFFIAGAQTRIVGYNAFIEGSLFRDNDNDFPTQEQSRFIGLFQIGFVILCDSFQFAYLWNRTSPEFGGQPAHSFGTLDFSWRW